MGIDIPGRQPAVGTHAIRLTVTRAEGKKLDSLAAPPDAFVLWEKDALEAAKFVGLVARVHTYINDQEAKNVFPGCRTVVATGMIAFSPRCTAILALARFFWTGGPFAFDPYHYPGVDAGVSVTPVSPEWSTAEAVSVEILRRSSTYQPLNAFFLTWLQLAEFIWTEMIHRDNAYDRRFKEMIEAPTPSLDEINARPRKYWLLKTTFSLEEDFGDLKTTPET